MFHDDMEENWEFDPSDFKASSVTLPDYLGLLVNHFRDAYEQRKKDFFAEEKFIYRSPLWDFLRYAKTHPDLQKLSVRAAHDRLVGCLDSIGESWISFSGIYSEDDGEDEFYGSWPEIKWAKPPIQTAFELAQTSPVALLEKHQRSHRYTLFVSVAYWLQRELPGRSIFLPVGLVAKALGVEKMQVSRYRKHAIADGFLKVVKAHEFHGGSGRATEFSFVLEAFSVNQREIEY